MIMLQAILITIAIFAAFFFIIHILYKKMQEDIVFEMRFMGILMVLSFLAFFGVVAHAIYTVLK